MKKILLITIILLAISAMFNASPVWAEQTSREYSKVYDVEDRPMTSFKHPTPWLDLGADFRFRFIYDNARKASKKDIGHDRIQQRYRLRTWAKIKHSDDVTTDIRLAAEPRYFTRPTTNDKQLVRHELLFDRLNVTWKNPFDLPVTAIIGRQDMKMGTGWLLLDGTPLDGGRTGFFDGLKLSYDLPGRDSTAHLLLIDNHADSAEWLKPFNDRDFDLIEQDERGLVLYLNNRLPDNKEHDYYFIYKQDRNRAISTGFQGEIYTLGSMWHGMLNNKWEYCVEVAPQFGHKNGKQLNAFATNNRMTYHYGDAKKNRVFYGYEYLSGNDDKDKNFDRVWGRLDQWSILQTGDLDSIDGRKYDSSNLHRINLGWITEPTGKLKVETNYHILFADDNTSAGGTNGLSKGGNFRGQLIRNQIDYKATEHVSHRFETELFFPGDFYNKTRNDIAVLFRYAILLTW